MLEKRWAKYIGETKDGLIKGKFYQITSYFFSEERISLKDFDGKYDIKQFVYVDEEEVQQKKTYIAFAKHMPEIGKELFIVRIDNGTIQPVQISGVVDVSYVEGDVYRIETENSVYMTEIIA